MWSMAMKSDWVEQQVRKTKGDGAALHDLRFSRQLPDLARTARDRRRAPRIRSSFNTEAYEQLSELDRASVQMLVENLDTSWNLEALTNLIYTIPKIVRGLPGDAPADAELKQAQRSFFIALYQLICGRETGPRIPTLLLSLGKE